MIRIIGSEILNSWIFVDEPEHMHQKYIFPDSSQSAPEQQFNTFVISGLQQTEISVGSK